MHIILALLILNISFWLYSCVIIFMEYQKFEKCVESGLPVFFLFNNLFHFFLNWEFFGISFLF
jgi:hypothetical protein